MLGVTTRVIPPSLAALAAVLLAFPPTASAGGEAAGREKTIARLRQFAAREAVFRDSPAADSYFWLACDQLSRRTGDHELPDVEAFAVGPEARNVRWLLAGILVRRNRTDAAARVMVCALAEEPEARAYRTWKWWDYHFRGRPDFDEMSGKIVEGFLRQFERGTPAERLVIADAFGKGRREAELTAAEFREAIGWPEPRPAPVAPSSPGAPPATAPVR